MQYPVAIDRFFDLRQIRASIAIAAVGTAAFAWIIGASAQEMSNGELAAAIRASGNPCQRVIEKERAGEGSSVWRVTCNSGHFQVTMNGDAQPDVVPLD